MELRVDRLLDELKRDPAAVLGRIEADPLLLHRRVGSLTLSNSSKLLFAPQESHHLYAKGIVYDAATLRLVSLPLLKIYNLGEKNITVDDLIALSEPVAGRRTSLHFLRKFDGTMIQRFQYGGRVWFSTRGMLEGGPIADEPQDDDTPERLGHFDYVGEARRFAGIRYPQLLECRAEWDGLTFVFEFIHPETKVITDYGTREDLILLTLFDRVEFRYRTFDELRTFAEKFHLTAVDALSPEGHSLPEQIDSLMASLKETDEEGTVLVLERDRRVVYRVKLKSPRYLTLLRMMLSCSYRNTVEMLDTFAEVPTWPEFEIYLQAKGSDIVPEELLAMYREHYESFAAYVALAHAVLQSVRVRFEVVRAEVERTAPPGDAKAFRRGFAFAVMPLPMRALYFTALDDKLTLDRVRSVLDTPEKLRMAADEMGVGP